MKKLIQGLAVAGVIAGAAAAFLPEDEKSNEIETSDAGVNASRAKHKNTSTAKKNPPKKPDTDAAKLAILAVLSGVDATPDVDDTKISQYFDKEKAAELRELFAQARAGGWNQMFKAHAELLDKALDLFPNEANGVMDMKNPDEWIQKRSDALAKVVEDVGIPYGLYEDTEAGNQVQFYVEVIKRNNPTEDHLNREILRKLARQAQSGDQDSGDFLSAAQMSKDEIRVLAGKAYTFVQTNSPDTISDMKADGSLDSFLQAYGIK